MKKIFSFMLSRMVIIGVLILLQAGVLILSILRLSNYLVYIETFFMLLSISIAIWLIGQKTNAAQKMAWLILILLFPIFGGLFYVLFGRNPVTDKMVKMGERIWKKTRRYLADNTEILEEIEGKNPDAARQVNYIQRNTAFPAYNNTSSEYLSPGEVLFERLKEELRGAEHYIFMEYFIIDEGKMWSEILEILAEKAKQGLDVRVMYDDIGCIRTLPYKYYRKLRDMGIKTVVFNPFVPALNIRMNNRNHRKITVIDGHTAFTGGINIGDEYINAKEKFGHWKDAGIILRGDAVWNFTIMFLQIWNIYDPQDKNLNIFLPHAHHAEDFKGDGYYLPFSDQPLDDEAVYENAYIQMLNTAKKYVYITTPYLIIGSEMINALSIAAKSGIDVKIITPHRWDKWYVHTVTRSYYRTLVEAGVKIYEYTPGFIHSKTYISDDTLGFVGTTNMDFRSLYMHFECGVWMFETPSLLQMRDDFCTTLEKCHEITLEETKSVAWPVRMLRAVLNVFAPLM